MLISESELLARMAHAGSDRAIRVSDASALDLGSDIVHPHVAVDLHAPVGSPAS